ncbi:hypothetical protein J2T02_002607 [Chitinophaga terrae (ex Kim and Jung 2007)]|nr:hypothetical protein [Chitinophaga terrae (ex Kim and Jung 2007)]
MASWKGHFGHYTGPGRLKYIAKSSHIKVSQIAAAILGLGEATGGYIAIDRLFGSYNMVGGAGKGKAL